MDKIKGFLTKNFPLIGSIGVLFLVIIAVVAMYKNYLVEKLATRIILAIAANDKKANTDLSIFDQMEIRAKAKSLLSSKTILELHKMNSLTDEQMITGKE